MAETAWTNNFFMTALAIILILLIGLPTIVPMSILVYRTHRKIGDPMPVPLGFLVDWVSRAQARPYGPDTDRIVDELTVLTRRDQQPSA